MTEEIKNLKIESVNHKISIPHGGMVNRKMHGLNVRLSGCVEYYFEDKTIRVNAGEMIFLPKGSTYTYKVISEGESERIVINVQGNINIKGAKWYSLDGYYAYNSISSFAHSWNFGDAGEYYMTLSQIYGLLSFICNYESMNYADRRKYNIIAPAVEYLKKNIYKTTFKIDNLHLLCGVSDTYFRKIFISRFGISPKNYVIKKRMSYAKSIIDSGDFFSVKQLSQSVGYIDPLYFSKVFKKYYGISPTTMNYME